jgi:hypothetical protein
MASKAAKLRAKRSTSKSGRPRKENMERFPSGKIKPFETEKENQSVAIEARRRIHGLQDMSDTEVKSDHVGYTLGRIYLDGKISKDQLEAGNEFALAIARYHRLTGIPFPSARAQSLFSIKGHDGEVSESMAKSARDASNKMMALQGVLLQCVDGPQVRTTVINVAVMDLDHLRDMPAQQNLWLRRGLSALRDSGILPNHNRNATDITRLEVSASS